MNEIQPSENMPPVPQEEVLPPQAPPPQASPQGLSTSEEHTWAMLAHLSILLNLITGFLGVITALVIHLVYKERSNYVAYQSMQAFLFQLIWWVGGGLLVGLTWVIAGTLTAVIVGICLWPVACLITFIPVAALVYGIIGAVKANSGEDFKYWLIGDWVRGELTRS
ncbi:MAG: hypothetical protein C3F13_12795 [Anaerolineales bacterium]|nr:DUF4870 domain-containing protein [Anaerolineae bacterium]PWB51781.1 MAG: hypothetical protein C3F13_12795 [Anaerolineales bacterium]